jgi:hypothetical protein
MESKCPGCGVEKFIDVAEDRFREFECGSSIAFKGDVVIKPGEFLQSESCARIASLAAERRPAVDDTGAGSAGGAT